MSETRIDYLRDSQGGIVLDNQGLPMWTKTYIPDQVIQKSMPIFIPESSDLQVKIIPPAMRLDEQALEAIRQIVREELARYFVNVGIMTITKLARK